MKKPFSVSAYGDYKGSAWIIWANTAEEAEKKVKKCLCGKHKIKVVNILETNQNDPLCVHIWAE